MLRGSGGFLSLQIHFVIVTTLSASDANKQRGCKMPTMVLIWNDLSTTSNFLFLFSSCS
jgi:hypothetical protein